MTSTSTMTTVNTSNLRQSSRRTNPLRTSRSTGRTLGSGSLGGAAGASAQESSQSTNGPIGFYPAITHFTDAITALPREFRRHTSFLKEVDAKAFAPEERLLESLNEVLALPHPKKLSRSEAGPDRRIDKTTGSAGNDPANDNVPVDLTSQSSAPSESAAIADLPRRMAFLKLRRALTENLVTMDEKNHVLGEAIKTTAAQLGRLDAVLPHVENEISEDARWGNLHHWAYNPDKSVNTKEGTTANQRSRREINHAPAIIHDTDVASRSELRREAVQARKQRAHAIDSDFDDPRASSKRTNGASKAKRPADTVQDAAVGLGIGGATSTTKRRKVEKPNPAAIAMERTISGVLSNSVRGHSREPSAPEAFKKRRAPPTSNNGTRKRQERLPSSADQPNRLNRNNTATSAADSPNLASSPVIGTFAPNARDQLHGSPIPTSVQRPQSSRARQNSIQDQRQRPDSSASNKLTNGNIGASTPELNTVITMTGRSALEIKTAMKESINGNGDRLLEDGDGGDLRGGIVVSKDSLKVETAETNGDTNKTVEQFVTSRGRTSKTSTPIQANFPEPRARPSRNVDQPKRSHKKGAGLAAQLAAAHVVDEEGSSIQGDDEEDDEDGPRYCYCNGVSYGDMIGCDGDDCPREWFHLECVGLQRAPPKNAKWYCDDCKENLKKGKTSSSR